METLLELAGGDSGLIGVQESPSGFDEGMEGF